MKNRNSFRDEWKTLWEKEKMLVTSIFSFSHNVFKSFPFQGRYQSGLRGKQLNKKLKDSSGCTLMTYDTPITDRYCMAEFVMDCVYSGSKYVICRNVRCPVSAHASIGFRSGRSHKRIFYTKFLKVFFLEFVGCLQSSVEAQFTYREYVYSVAVYQKYRTRLGELIVFKPGLENYHFSQPS